jgi:hypothetical protein
MRPPRPAALAWFRSAWPALASVPRLLRDDSRLVWFARTATPFLVESENWPGLVDVAGAGVDAAGRLAAEEDRGYLL